MSDIGNVMAKKGSVRRMDSSMPKTGNKKMDLGDEMPISWKKDKYDLMAQPKNS